MSFSGDITPKGYRQGQMAQFDPQQMQLYKQMFNQVGDQSYLAKLAAGDQSTFAETEAPAMRQFQGLLGQLGSRFSGMGMGSRKGSGFNLSANQATSDFAQDLASKRQQLRMQAIQDLSGLSNSLLSQRPYDRFLVEKQYKQNPWADIAGKFAGAIPGAAVGFMTGGPAGAAMGAGSSFLNTMDEDFRSGQSYMPGYYGGGG